MKLSDIENNLKKLSVSKFPYTSVIGISRSLIALGTMLTLIFNSHSVIIQRGVGGKTFNPLLNHDEKLNQLNFFLLFGVENYNIAKILAILILALVISGFLIKISAILHWWVSISFFYSSSVIDGGDQIAIIITFLLLPLCLTDNRKNHWETIKPYFSVNNMFGLFSVFIIRLQVAIIYFHAAVGKFVVEEWANGTALYYWFNHSFFGAPDSFIPFLNLLLSIDWVVTFLTYGVLIFELLLFLALTASIKYRKTLLPFAILFHFFIIIFHGIFSFFFSIVGGLILFLLPISKPLNIKLWFLPKSN